MTNDTSQDSLTTSQLPSDEQMFADFLRGDRASLVAVIKRHEVRLARIAYRITRCVHEAEDVRHSVVVRLLRSLESQPQLERVGAWLTRCTVNEALTRMRRRNREGRLLADLASDARSAAAESLTESVTRRESRERLSTALAQITPDDRALLSLRFDEDLTFREIAEVLGRPTSTVKSQMSQAIFRLRELLSGSSESQSHRR